MRKIVALVLVSGCLVFQLSAATGPVVPSPIQSWYQDLNTIIANLAKDLEISRDAKAVAKAFTAAIAAVQTKQIGERKGQVEAQYPNFFAADIKEGGSMNTSSAWIKLSQDFSQTLTRYSTALSKVHKFLSDANVAKALDDFNSALQSFIDPET